MFLLELAEATGDIIGVDPEKILVKSDHRDTHRNAGYIGCGGFVLAGIKNCQEQQAIKRFFHSDSERKMGKNVVLRM
jgi:hypothetical protein